MQTRHCRRFRPDPRFRQVTKTPCAKSTVRQPRVNFQRVSNAALANGALANELENWRKYSRWGAALKNKSKKPRTSIFTLSRAGIDAGLVKEQFSFRRGAPPIENKFEPKNQTLRWRLAKVAFDIVQHLVSNLVAEPLVWGVLRSLVLAGSTTCLRWRTSLTWHHLIPSTAWSLTSALS